MSAFWYRQGGPVLFEILLRTHNRFLTEKLRQQEQIEAARLVYARLIREAK